MATDYANQKVAELQDLLKERGLPHTGKKADLISRLQESDKSKTGQPEPKAQTESKVAEATTKAQAGANEEENPVQEEAIPETTDKPETTNDQDAVPETTKEDFSAKIPELSLEEEMEKRRKRAERFGTSAKKNEEESKGADEETTAKNDKDDEAAKLLERQKRFGGVAPGGNVGGVEALNHALPERQKKRGREGAANGERAGKRHDSRKRDGRGKGKNGIQTSKETAPAKKTSSEQAEKDKLAAEKRKARFATSATAS